MKVLYVSGKLTGATALAVADNVHQARMVAAQLVRMGASVICPHTNFEGMGGVVDEASFLAADLELLGRCDGLVTVPGFEASLGSLDEIQFALHEKLPVFDYPRHLMEIAQFILSDEGDDEQAA